ncbi:uncharacterized protein LOC129594421 isoform X1 [Paramacrobiotus metropolitanus]|uniref:uncharacterized protein LOC129594421 isoform X1 n=1 Tax=Paramacrobiotus metropolitanus TaxID=2943436 RepID=UPI0024457457|nr:uncharacterized protein LOC129594421 isoform X1 [Paramacrobiotus metropolitanus]
MFENDLVWCYGAVDVQDDDGSFRHGLIVDVDVARGCFIDFGYPGHHTELIPFHRCFGRISHYLFAPGDTVQILWRGSNSEAFRWYPATVIAGSYHTFAVVEAQRQGKIVKEVARRMWIMPSGERPSFELNSYKRLSMPLSWITAVLAKARSKQDFWWWNREHGHSFNTIFVKVESRKLLYIAQGDESRRWNFWGLVEVFRIMAKRTTTYELRNGKRYLERERDKPIAFKSFLATISTTLYQHQPCINTCIPVEVFHRIFSFLEFQDELNSSTVYKYLYSSGSLPSDIFLSGISGRTELS